MIKLDNNYKIKIDNMSFTLVFSEEREREKLNKKRQKTGEKEKYIYKDYWFYPTLGQCLSKWQYLILSDCKDLKTTIKKVDYIFKQIKNLEKVHLKNINN